MLFLSFSPFFKKLVPAFLTGLFLLQAALQAQSDPFGGPMAEPRRLHDKGVDGDAEAVTDCIALLEKLLESDPKNQIARVYLGSAYTLRSRDLGIGPGKLEALKKGGALMDAAVAEAPKDMRVRLIRAINNLQLPSIFGRRDMAYADFEWLHEQLKTREAELSTPELQATYYYVGMAMRHQKRKKEAKETWEVGIAVDASTQLAGKMREEISVKR